MLGAHTPPAPTARGHLYPLQLLPRQARGGGLGPHPLGTHTRSSILLPFVFADKHTVGCFHVEIVNAVLGKSGNTRETDGEASRGAWGPRRHGCPLRSAQPEGRCPAARRAWPPGLRPHKRPACCHLPLARQCRRGGRLARSGPHLLGRLPAGPGHRAAHLLQVRPQQQLLWEQQVAEPHRLPPGASASGTKAQTSTPPPPPRFLRPLQLAHLRLPAVVPLGHL